MADYVDLHLHTRFSDGTDAPAAMLERAAELGFRAAAITDHDTVGGVAEALRAAQTLGLDFLSGVEISASFANKELHVTGLGIRLDFPPLLEELDTLRKHRAERAAEILARLNALGIAIDPEDLEARAKGAAIGRLHIAQELHAKGITKTVQKAFDQYIGGGRDAFISKVSADCETALELIHAAGGLAFLAHPGIGKVSSARLTQLLQLPFDGIEAYHSKHTPGQVTAFLQIAAERHLLISGGSDCHGAAKGTKPDLGKVRVPYAHFERIREALER